MDRKEAEQTIRDLYDTQEPFLSALFAEMGTAALSDAGIIRLAELQIDRERRRGEYIDRVANYQKSHPGLSWAECESAVKWRID